MTSQTENPDFASAAMMRLVRHGLALQGIDAPHLATAGAHVERGAKSALMQSVLETHGPGAILRIGDAVADLPPQPLAQALLLADTVHDLMARWHRVERFSHGSHRVATRALAAHQVGLSHRSRLAGATPSPAETLLVFGVLTGFAETALGQPATVSTGSGAVWRRDGRWTERAGHGAPEPVALTCMPRPARDPDPKPQTDRIDSLRVELAQDPVKRWKIDDVARNAGLSVRSLQRMLASRSLSFSALIAETRLETAGRYLCDKDGPGLTEIGFLSGYSDQAHFTRAFKKSVGTTPAAFRADFHR